VEHVRERAAPRHAVVTREDLLGALACFWLVFFASFPAAVPFLFLDDPWIALRVSNGVLLALMFYAGFSWAKYTLATPWLTGICFVLGGLGLVAVAIALGG
jgi:VIT1/CCC1 family predicted Fe2+/Mn2+ transporter